MRVLLMLLASVVSLGAHLRAQSTGGRLVVLNKEEATLVTVEAANGKVLGRVATGEGPHEVAVSDDGRTAFVANYGTGSAPGSTISVIDLSAHKELRRVDVSPLRRPHGIHVADGKVYFTAEVNRLVARYDPQSNRVDWLLGTGQAGTHMVLVSADGARMYTANIGSNTISIIERGANPLAWNETLVSVGRGPEGFDVSPDGRELWAAHSQDGGVSILDLAEKKVTATLDLQTKRSNRLKFTRDGKRVLISDLDAGQLVVVDAASRKEVKRLPLGRMPEGILIPPDGATAYVAVAGEGLVAVVDLATLEVTGKIETGKGPDGMAWIK
jgi:YVTN family beta-propeller protein